MEEEIRHQKPHKNSEITLRKEDEEKIMNEVIKNMISKFTEEEKASLEKLFTKINKEPLEKPLQPHDHIKPNEKPDKIAPHNELEHHHVKPNEKPDKIAPHDELEHHHVKPHEKPDKIAPHDELEHHHVKPNEKPDKIAPHDELEHHHVKPNEKPDKIAPHNEFEHLELMIDLCENKNELIRILTDINRILLDSCKNQYHVNVKKRK